MPRFFVPHADGKDERIYGQFADWCASHVPAADRRIYRIAWRHDGDDWIATVGETLSGVSVRRRRREGGTVDVTTPVHDPATVLAIFAGDPYLVVTDGRPLGSIISAWLNPFMAGIPTSVTFFDPPA